MQLNVVEVYFTETESWFECKLKNLDFVTKKALVRFNGKAGVWKNREEWTPFRHLRGSSLPSSRNFTPGEKVEVLNSSSDDEPFSWWPAIALGVTADSYVIVTYEGWGDDYNDVFEPDLLRPYNTSPVLSSMTDADICRIPLSPALRKYLADGTLQFGNCENIASLVPESGVVMHLSLSECGAELTVIGASLKMREVLKQVVRALAAQALLRALDDFDTTNHVKSPKNKNCADKPKTVRQLFPPEPQAAQQPMSPVSPVHKQLPFPHQQLHSPVHHPVHAQQQERPQLSLEVDGFNGGRPIACSDPISIPQKISEDPEWVATSFSVSKLSSLGSWSFSISPSSSCPSSPLNRSLDYDLFDSSDDSFEFKSSPAALSPRVADDDSAFKLSFNETFDSSFEGCSPQPYTAASGQPYMQGVPAIQMKSPFQLQTELNSPLRVIKKNAPAFKQSFQRRTPFQLFTFSNAVCV